MYEAKIIRDSVSPDRIRLATLQLTYPRFVHSELMTHRMFSRNSASSRAIPTEKMLQQIIEDPVMPVWWGQNQSGMQARTEVQGEDLTAAKEFWLDARDDAVGNFKLLQAVDLHKQIVNRTTEPWMWITVVVTATEWNNFFALRSHPDAQPEIRQIADMAREIFLKSVPEPVEYGEWHLPYWGFEDDYKLEGQTWTLDEESGLTLPVPVLVSTGRTARVSYLTHEGRRDVRKDIDLAAERLSTSAHWSPFEHPATPMSKGEMLLREQMVTQARDTLLRWEDQPNAQRILRDLEHSLRFSGNFKGWVQARKVFPYESGKGSLIPPIETS